MSDQEEDWGESTEDELKVKRGNPAFHSDRLFFRVIVFTLGGVNIIGIIGIITLAWCNNEVPDALTAIVSGAAGSLGAVLANNQPK